MAQDIGSSPSTTQRNLWGELFNNPVAIKELRSRMRGYRAFAVLTLYLIALSGVAVLVYMASLSSSSAPAVTMSYTVGKALFAAVVGVQVILAAFIGPAFTAGAISNERERQTFDLLRTTLLSPHVFVLGKLISALSYIFLLVLASIPVQSIAFLLGGLSPTELILSQLVIVIAAITYALYGLWCSAALRSTMAATVATFAGMLLVLLGLPLFALLLLMVRGVPFGASTGGPLFEIILVYGGLALAATNLPATLVVSELFLLQQDTLLAYSQLINGRTIWVFSPWWVFVILHAVAAVALYMDTVRRVRRVSDV